MAEGRSGDEILTMLSALANAHRLRALAALRERKVHVSELARELGIGRPLLHMHLKVLERAGLVAGHHELSPDGKALRYYEVTDFSQHLTPQRISEAAATLSLDNGPQGKAGR